MHKCCNLQSNPFFFFFFFFIMMHYKQTEMCVHIADTNLDYLISNCVYMWSVRVSSNGSMFSVILGGWLFESP
jgi:hypothetical protein